MGGGGGEGGNDNWAPMSTKWVRDAETQTLSAQDSVREVSESVLGGRGAIITGHLCLPSGSEMMKHRHYRHKILPER